VRAIDRIFSVLDAFTVDHPKLTLQDISDRIDLSKATTFRLVNSLGDAGYLVRLDDQRYCLSLKLVKLAGVVVNGLGVRDIAHPVMVEIGRETGETVSLNTVVGTDRVCVDVVESNSRIMHIVNLGEHAALLYGATGKTLLAHLPEPEQVGIIKTLPRGATFTQAELKVELARIRKQGYAVTSGERVPGALAISVAIFDINDRAKYSLTLTGPASRMKEHHERNLACMLEAQGEISSRLGSSRFSNA
jgi:IclR family KDG regulon transcriptional repressor